MSGFGRNPTGAHPAGRSIVHEARLAVTAVERALRDGGLAGPAEAYHLMGSLGLLTRTLQRTLNELATWLRKEQNHRQLTVVEGPFIDDPEAAVNVAAQSLMQASRACQEAFDALERAHIAMAHVGAERGPAERRARRAPRRRRRM